MILVSKARYKVNAVYRAIQGEGWWAGTPCTLVRLQGCNLHCPFCDTEAALDPDEGAEMSLADLVKQVLEVHVTGQMILITGGEPTLQPMAPLVSVLSSVGPVHLETNGTIALPDGLRFSWVTVSPKVPWCGDAARVATQMLGRADEIKWLVGREKDIEKLKGFLVELEKCDFADYKRICVQPISGSPGATKIAYRACLENGWRLSLQLHKCIGKP